MNVTSLKAFRMVKYICRGEVDMDKPSMASVRQYKQEIYFHFDNLLYLANDVLRVLLWRGRVHVSIPKPSYWFRNSMKKKKRYNRIKRKDNGTIDDNDDDDDHVMKVSFWFPIRSMILFQTIILMIERPRLIPGLSFCFIGTILFYKMVSRSLHPIPWYRCKVCTTNTNTC